MVGARQLRRTWFRLLAAGPIILLFAIAPAFLYFDHWDDMATYAVYGSGAIASTENPEHDHASHQGHCHFGSASCAERTAPSSSVVVARVIELPSPRLTAVALDDRSPTLSGIAIAPPIEPPRL